MNSYRDFHQTGMGGVFFNSRQIPISSRMNNVKTYVNTFLLSIIFAA